MARGYGRVAQGVSKSVRRGTVRPGVARRSVSTGGARVRAPLPGVANPQRSSTRITTPRRAVNPSTIRPRPRASRGPVFGPPAPTARDLGNNSKRTANWVKKHKVGLAAGAVGIAAFSQRSGRGTDRTNYNTSKGIYGY